jgi:hypothetical protein
MGGSAHLWHTKPQSPAQARVHRPRRDLKCRPRAPTPGLPTHWPACSRECTTARPGVEPWTLNPTPNARLGCPPAGPPAAGKRNGPGSTATAAAQSSTRATRAPGATACGRGARGGGLGASCCRRQQRQRAGAARCPRGDAIQLLPTLHAAGLAQTTQQPGARSSPPPPAHFYRTFQTSATPH